MSVRLQSRPIYILNYSIIAKLPYTFVNEPLYELGGNLHIVVSVQKTSWVREFVRKPDQYQVSFGFLDSGTYTYTDINVVVFIPLFLNNILLDIFA